MVSNFAASELMGKANPQKSVFNDHKPNSFDSSRALWLLFVDIIPLLYQQHAFIKWGCFATEINLCFQIQLFFFLLQDSNLDSSIIESFSLFIRNLAFGKFNALVNPEPVGVSMIFVESYSKYVDRFCFFLTSWFTINQGSKIKYFSNPVCGDHWWVAKIYLSHEEIL